jgi:curved DNA-binding protein CbpA
VRTHYELLGVSEDATTEEIRQAYLRVAKANHPDRRQSDDAARRVEADTAIKAANAAWNVLRDPVRRSEYDRSLRGAPSASGRPTGGTGGPSRPVDREPSGLVVRADHAPVFRYLPAAVVIVVLLGVLVFSAYATSRDSTGPAAGPTSTAPTYPVGTCVLIAALDSGPEPVKVACGTGNSGRVTAIVDTPRPCPPDTRALPLDDNRTTLCLKSAG